MNFPNLAVRAESYSTRQREQQARKKAHRVIRIFDSLLPPLALHAYHKKGAVRQGLAEVTEIGGGVSLTGETALKALGNESWLTTHTQG